MGIMGIITGLLGGINSIGKAVSPIANLFAKSPGDRQAEKETHDQQALEAAGMDIQRRMNEGSLDPGEALKALDNLIVIAGRGSTGAIALTVLNNIRTNIQSQANWRQDAAPDKGAGLSSISTDPATQQAWIRRQMRDKMLGFQQGSDNLAGSPMERLYKPAFDPYKEFEKSKQTADQAFTPYKAPDRFGEIRKRLGIE